MDLLSQCGVHGWDGPPTWVLLSAVRAGVPLCLVGEHGSGKTRVCQVLGLGLAGPKCRTVRYDMAGETELGLFGLPDLERAKRGQLAFVPHDRSIQSADVIVLDELPRAARDIRNLVMTVVDERRLLGQDLDFRLCVATANPGHDYHTTVLDPAQASRFAFLSAPPFNSYTADDRAAVITSEDPTCVPALVELLTTGSVELPGPVADVLLQYTLRVSRGLHDHGVSHTGRQAKHLYRLACAYVELLTETGTACSTEVVTRLTLATVPSVFGVVDQRLDVTQVTEVVQAHAELVGSKVSPVPHTDTHLLVRRALENPDDGVAQALALAAIDSGVG